MKHKILQKRYLSDDTFVLRFERNGLEFNPGQHLTVGPFGSPDRREYSIYSGTKDDYLEVLVKRIDEGQVTPKLNKLKEGDDLEINGPFGFFQLQEDPEAHHYFISTGTGISPFHCFAHTDEKLQYTLLHGIRFLSESYDAGHYPTDRYISCTSRSDEGQFHGRVTQYLSDQRLPTDGQYYLCGNCDMIYEAYDILVAKGIDRERIQTEVYF
ncbi:ferredoxin--NADP reductase [Spirochaeta cellobiosiphila]|uniref:ferredoxin--NADP reductase n=1 Tax=Spirochaeta cellobiosiphila TaxID=504483 RepID=UPI00041B5031|nr:FAD-binding oxidoreductase [Spirochaeta cellobiosiphila]